MDSKQFITEVVPPISTGLNVISLISSVAAVLLFSFVAYQKPSLVNRVSLRLQVGISFFDMLNHFFALFHHLKDVPTSFCQFIGFYRAFGAMVYCFLNICIALNLQLIFLHNLQPNRKWEIVYWSVTLILTFVANIVPLAAGYFGVNGDGLCFVTRGLPHSDTILAVNINGVNVFTFLYCLIVTLLVVLKLLRNASSLEDTTFGTLTNGDSRPEIIHQLKKLALRISIYPVLCFLSLSGFNARYFIRIAGGNASTIGLLAWTLVGLSTAGFFNLIAFLLDPTFQAALNVVFKNSFGKSEQGTAIENKLGSYYETKHSIEMSNPGQEINVIVNEDGSSTVITSNNEVEEKPTLNELAKFM